MNSVQMDFMNLDLNQQLVAEVANSNAMKMEQLAGFVVKRMDFVIAGMASMEINVKKSATVIKRTLSMETNAIKKAYVCARKVITDINAYMTVTAARKELIEMSVINFQVNANV